MKHGEYVKELAIAIFCNKLWHQPTTKVSETLYIMCLKRITTVEL